MRLCKHILRLVPTLAPALAPTLILALALATAGYAHRLAQPEPTEIAEISSLYGDAGWLCGEGGGAGRAECAACLPLASGLPPRGAANCAPPLSARIASTVLPPAPAPHPGRAPGQIEARAPPRL